LHENRRHPIANPAKVAWTAFCQYIKAREHYKEMRYALGQNTEKKSWLTRLVPRKRRKTLGRVEDLEAKAVRETSQVSNTEDGSSPTTARATVNEIDVIMRTSSQESRDQTPQTPQTSRKHRKVHQWV
jgi:hypothetical protein